MRRLYPSAALTYILCKLQLQNPPVISTGVLFRPTPVCLAAKQQHHKSKEHKNSVDHHHRDDVNDSPDSGVNNSSDEPIHLGDFYDTSLEEAGGAPKEMFVPSAKKFAALNRVLQKKFGVTSVRRLNRKQLAELERVVDMRFLLDKSKAMKAVPPTTTTTTATTRQRLRSRRQKGPAEAQPAGPRYVDTAVFQLPLHEMDTIHPNIIQSLKNHNRMFLFGNTDRLVKNSVVPLHTTFTSELLGSLVYLKIVHLPSHTHAGERRPSAAYTAEVERVQRQLIRFILTKVITPTYSARSIAPFKNEACFDVGLYCTLTPVLRAAAQNVQQFEEDSEELQRHFAEAKKEIRGLQGKKEVLSGDKQHKIILDHLFHPSSRHGGADPFRSLAPKKKSVDPYALDSIIGEIAARARKDALLPFAASYKQQRGRDAGTPGGPNMDDFHLCVGTANTPFFAKLACDMAGKRQIEKGKKSALPNQVFVQSFCNRVRTVKEAVNLMASMPFRQLPTVTPAFATEVLEGVFGVTTCGEFEKKKEELCFSLSKETFEHCYAAVYGRLHFKEEDEARAMYPEYFLDASATSTEDSETQKRQDEMRERGLTTTFSQRIQNSLYHTSYALRYQKALAPLAHNSIQIYNEKKTAVRPTFRQFTKSNLDVFYTSNVQNNASYGRLISNSAFESIVERTIFFTYKKLRYEGLCCGTVRLDLLRNYKIHVATITVPLPESTNSFPAIWQHVKQKALSEMQQKRQRTGAEPTGDIFTLSVMFLKLTMDPTVMPAAMRQELQRVEKQYMQAKNTFSRSDVFGYLRSHARYGRGRPLGAKGGKKKKKKTEKEKRETSVAAEVGTQKKVKAKRPPEPRSRGAGKLYQI